MQISLCGISKAKNTSSKFFATCVKVLDSGGFITPPHRLIDWKFARDVYVGTKFVPRDIGPESITHLPRVPELSAQSIFQIIVAEAGMAAYFPDQPARGWATYKVQRNYLFAVLRWKKPGMITRLVRAAMSRKNPAFGAQQPQANAAPGALQAQFTASVGGSRRTGRRAAYWLLTEVQRANIRQNRVRLNRAQRRTQVALVIRAAFAGNFFSKASHTRADNATLYRFNDNGVVCQVIYFKIGWSQRSTDRACCLSRTTESYSKCC